MPLSFHQSSHRALLWALGLSLVFHALLLTLKWASPATFDRIFETNTLEVVLVNSRSKNAPDAPLALAQVNLAGGGQVPGNNLQTSPYSAQSVNANAPELQQVEEKIEALKNEIKHNKEHDIIKFKEDIRQELESEIVSRYYLHRGAIEYSFNHDVDVKEALRLFANMDEYHKILKGTK